jgi:hypothetical protein
MAVVIWLFVGGGEAEIRGLVPFLKKHFPSCEFCRMTPVLRRPGPRPGVKPTGYGKTGKSLIAEIRERLPAALTKGERCDAVLIINDLDCRNEDAQQTRFLKAIDAIDEAKTIDRFIGFAAPELEVWIIADWDGSVAKHADFRSRHNRMRHWLSSVKSIPFESPESFGKYDAQKDFCCEKLSELIIESTTLHPEDRFKPKYSKGSHTPLLLLQINPLVVKDKCPIFRKLYSFLTDCADRAGF